MFRSALIACLAALWPHAAAVADMPTKWKVEHPIHCLAVSADGKLVAVGGPARKLNAQDPRAIFQPGSVTLLDAATGKPRRTLATQRAVVALAFSPDGKRLAIGELNRGGVKTGARRGTVFPRVLDVESGKQVLELDGHNDMINGLAYLPGGKRLATASGDGTARIWDAGSGKELLVLKTGYFNDSLTLSPDGKRLAVGSGNPVVTIWDAEKGTALLKLDHRFSGHHIAFSADGTLIAVGANGVSDVTLWDGKSGTKKGVIVVRTARVSNITSNLIFSPDGKYLLTGNGDLVADKQPADVVIWDLAGKKLHSRHKGHPARVERLAFTPDGKKLISASVDGTILVWDFARMVQAR
jgi:WD40 repeat protein